MVRSSAFAAFRLMTSSNLVGCSMGSQRYATLLNVSRGCPIFPSLKLLRSRTITCYKRPDAIPCQE
jgi:hypothetical protein